MPRGYTLDTRPVPSASQHVFDRGGRHRRNWRQVSGLRRKILITYAFFAKSNHCLTVDSNRTKAGGVGHSHGGARLRIGCGCRCRRFRLRFALGLRAGGAAGGGLFEKILVKVGQLVVAPRRHREDRITAARGAVPPLSIVAGGWVA